MKKITIIAKLDADGNVESREGFVAKLDADKYRDQIDQTKKQIYSSEETITVWDEGEYTQEAQIKQRAIEKLSLQERIALGLEKEDNVKPMTPERFARQQKEAK